MSFDYLTAIAGSTSLLIVTFVAAGWLWIYWKTGSSHAPSMRVWRVLTGREITDKTIRDYIEEQDSLMAFRLGSGMRTRSAAHAHRAIAFVAKYDLSPDHLRQVGGYFDADELKMANPPSVGLRIYQFITATLLVVVFFLAGFATLEQRILISLKQTGAWFWVSQSSAQYVSAPFSKGVRLPFVGCPKTAVQEPSSLSDLEILCSVKEDPAFEGYLKETLQEQRIAFIILMIAAFLTALSQWKEFLRANAAIRLGKELASKLSAATAGDSRDAESVVGESTDPDPA